MEVQIVYGIHAVKALLERAHGTVLDVRIDRAKESRRLRELGELAAAKAIAIEAASREQLDALSGQGNHQGAVARCRPREVLGENALDQLLDSPSNSTLLLILDGVTDPHNLGACLRTADAAGVKALILPKDRSCPLNATVRKVASGAAQSVPLVRVTNLARVMDRLKESGLWILGMADEAGDELYQLSLTGPLAVVMGGERSGLRRLTRKQCDHLARIPMGGLVSSLNVSVAAGVVLYEIFRQHNHGV